MGMHSIHIPRVARRLAHCIGRNWARLSYGRHVEPTWLEVNSTSIPVAGLGAEFAGLRIAHLSDFHCARHLPLDYLDRAISRALDAAPDLIALTGDFVHSGYRHIEAVARILSKCQAPMGVFAVLGNHDYSIHNSLGIRHRRGLHKGVAEALTSCGIHVLRNETVELKRGDANLYLVGLDDLWAGECDPATAMGKLNPLIPRIVLAHHPDTYERLAPYRCDLMLSGHTHGGQVDWPGLGRFLLAKRARNRAAGLYRVDDSFVYVNKGIGCGFRFRFGVRPEIAIHTLQPI